MSVLFDLAQQEPVRPEPTVMMDALADAFRGLCSGATAQPAQTVLEMPNGEGDCIIYSAYVASSRAFGAKLSPYLTSRSRAGLSPVTAYTVLLDAVEGTPIGLVDSLALTVERTAATTALAVRQIMRGCAVTKIAVIGTGPVGRAHARYARCLYPDAQVMLFSPTATGVDAGARERKVAIGDEVARSQVASSVAEAVADASVVMACTSSGIPVLDLGKVADGALVTSVATNAPDAHEIDWRELPELDVYCDYAKTCPTTAGDMRLAIAAGAWTADAVIADIPQLLDGTPPLEGPKRLRYFRSTGLGLEDVVVASVVLGSGR